LIRHGDADAEIPEALTDEARALNSKARQVLHGHFSALASRMVPLDLILTSPLVRAVQTAQILSLAQKHEGLLRAHRSLLPETPVGALDSVLSAHPEQTLALVGHQPSMGAMAAHLLGLKNFPKPVMPGTVIGLAKGEQDGAAPATLLFYAAPGQEVIEEV
jgi:phosphohistidine phosphatase